MTGVLAPVVSRVRVDMTFGDFVVTMMVACGIMYLGLTVFVWLVEYQNNCTLIALFARQWRYLKKASKRLW